MRCPKCGGLLIEAWDEWEGREWKCVNWGRREEPMPKFTSDAAREQYRAKMRAHVARRRAQKAGVEAPPPPSGGSGKPGLAAGVELSGLDAALEAIEQKLVALTDLKRQLLHTRELVSR